MRFFILAICLIMIAFSPLAHADTIFNVHETNLRLAREAELRSQQTRHMTPPAVLDQHEVRCLTANIYFEARNQGRVGMEAVGAVTLNRLKRGFAPTICDVVWQRTAGVCQFSWTCAPPHKITEPKFARLAHDIAERLMRGYVLGNVEGALYYHADYASARAKKWFGTLNRVAQIGAHIFYRKETMAQK